MSQPSELRSTHVVTCFLRRSDSEQPRILLLQRSQRVGTYHAHWAGVSGFVEPNVSPDEQAYTEIREETGLQRDQVRILRRGTNSTQRRGKARLSRPPLSLRGADTRRHQDRLGSRGYALDCAIRIVSI